MNPKAIGERSEACVLAALAKKGKIVLLPFGNNQRYDLVVDEGGGRFVRVQVKTGLLRNGTITATTRSSKTHRGTGRRCYRGDCELFAVYCPANDKTYLVPVCECPGTEIALRVSPTKNSQAKRIRWAQDYEL